MARKGENIYYRKDGRWEGRWIYSYDKDGKAHYRSVYANSYTEVKEKLLQQKKSLLAPTEHFSPKTLGKYCEERLLTVKLRHKCQRPSILSSRSERILSRIGTVICQGMWKTN